MGDFSITRKELFDQIWASSIAEIARKYDVNYASLRKFIIENQIPNPSNLFMRQRNLGLDVGGMIPPLPGDPTQTITFCDNRNAKITKNKDDDETTDEDIIQQRANRISAIQELIDYARFFNYLRKISCDNDEVLITIEDSLLKKIKSASRRPLHNTKTTETWIPVIPHYDITVKNAAKPHKY